MSLTARRKETTKSRSTLLTMPRQRFLIGALETLDPAQFLLSFVIYEFPDQSSRIDRRAIKIGVSLVNAQNL